MEAVITESELTESNQDDIFSDNLSQFLILQTNSQFIL